MLLNGILCRIGEEGTRWREGRQIPGIGRTDRQWRAVKCRNSSMSMSSQQAAQHSRAPHCTAPHRTAHTLLLVISSVSPNTATLPTRPSQLSFSFLIPSHTLFGASDCSTLRLTEACKPSPRNSVSLRLTEPASVAHILDRTLQVRHEPRSRHSLAAFIYFISRTFVALLTAMPRSQILALRTL